MIFLLVFEYPSIFICLENVSNPLNTPYPSNMRCDEVCNDIIGLWTVGSNGFCMHQDVGFRVGARGYRIAAIEVGL